MIDLADVRSVVADALALELAAAGHAAVGVYPYPPDELALPAIWITSPFTLKPQDPRTIVADVSVIVAVDGAEPAQVAQLDRLQAIAWVALEKVGTATLATPTVFAAGGPLLHAVTLYADVDVDARTMCPPALELASSSSH